MALIQCPECGKSVSDKAKICPHCGFSSIKRENKKLTASILISVVVCVLMIGCAIYFTQSNQSDADSLFSDHAVYPASQTYSRATATPIPSTGNRGALAKAKQYLGFTAFSYSGLIKQLQYEGFSSSEATYAANNCGANWNQQALKKAKSYLSFTSFSYTGLIKQLEYEGFSNAEATYGVNYCGANWEQQAVKKAKSYLNIKTNWTISSLISQLQYEGFTYAQAKYGAENCGLK